MKKSVFKSLIGVAMATMVLGGAFGVASNINKEPIKAEAYGSGDTTWYIAREGHNWSKNDSRDHLTYSKMAGNNFEFKSDNFISLSKDEKFNIVYSWNNGSGWNTFTPNLQTDQSEEVVFEVPGDADYAVAKRDISVRFYFQFYGDGASWTGLYWEEEEVPPSTDKNTFYVYDHYNHLGTFNNIKVYGFGAASHIKPVMEYPGTHDGISTYSYHSIQRLYQVQLSVSYPKFIMNGTSKTVDVVLGNHSGQVLYIFNDMTGDGYNINWCSLDDLTVSDGTYLRGDWTNGWAVSGQLTMSLNPGNEKEVMVESLDLGAGGRVKVITYSNHWPEWHSPSSVGTQDPNYPVGKDENDNATVTKTSTYNLYVNFESWAYWFNPTANVDLEKATAFATAFNTAIEGKCTYKGGSAIGPLTTEWGNQLTEFGKLSTGAKAILTGAAKSHTVVAIGTFAGKYDYVYGKYGYDNNWTDFANRHPVHIGKVVPVIPGLADDSGSNSYIWIIVTSVITVAGVSVFFFLKKRKEDK